MAEKIPWLHIYHPCPCDYCQIRNFQRTTQLLISRSELVRCIKSAKSEIEKRTYKTPIQLKKEIVSILQKGPKAFITKVFTEPIEAMAHAKWVTITLKDLQIAICLRGHKENILFGWKHLYPNKYRARTSTNIIPGSWCRLSRTACILVSFF